MKTHFYHFGWMMAVLTQISSCQQIQEKEYSIKAEAVDDSGKPIKGIQVITGRIEPMVSPQITLGKPVTTDPVLTDENGIAIIKFSSLPEPSGNVNYYQDGWYSTSERVIWKKSNEQGDKLREAEIRAIIKPIKNPIPMIARNNVRIRTPEFGERYGFDLEMGEAVPPFGKGKTSDIELKLTGKRVDSADPEKEVIAFRSEISCPNEGDGFVEFSVADTKEFSKGSALPSAHEAPEVGYEDKIVRIAETDAEGRIGRLTNQSNLDEQKCYYFRVRTRKDTDGRIVSAHYGKMYGPLEIRPALKRYGHDVTKGQGGFYIQYLYFNPVSNDRNVEFDPKRNLNPDGKVQRP